LETKTTGEIWNSGGDYK